MADNELAEVLEEYFDRVRDEVVRPSVDPCVPDVLVNLATTDNVLRPALEVSLSKATPFNLAYPVEVATRAASYAISVLPLEDQDAAVASFLKHFAQAHMLRTAKGITLSSEWAEGPDKPSFPNTQD